MSQENVIIRFDKVTYEYNEKKQILDEASFSVRKNSIVTIMGQNGAGKSTIFKMLLGKIKPQSGKIHLENNASVGIAEQMIPHEKLDLTVLDYFKTSIHEFRPGDEGNVYKILRTVNLDIPLEKTVRELSGGQKARLLLAFALYSEPDILLLDEPTNNLDKAGIEHLTEFLINYKKTCIVISHDAPFLNSFTDGVLNLDVQTHKVEQFAGNYYDVLNEIEAKLKRDQLQNSRLQKSIKDRFEKVNKLGGKSVQMSQLARRIREDIEEDKESMVEMRKEDKTIAEFTIPNQEFVGSVIRIYKPTFKELYKGDRIIIKGPNGIGKSTLLKKILSGEAAEINPKIRVGYYSQDFTELDFNQTCYESLYDAALEKETTKIYAAASKFLLPGNILQNKIGTLSEGQKGLLCYARFMLQQPGLLILDEPTNHINFRHIPVIAKAINDYKGPIIMISHLEEFVDTIDELFEIELTSWIDY